MSENTKLYTIQCVDTGRFIATIESDSYESAENAHGHVCVCGCETRRVESVRTPNARFWHFSDNCGWVKITLAPLESLEWCKFENTEEGYRRVITSFTHNGGEVVRENLWNERDCDGDASHSSAASAEILNDLNVIPVDEEIFKRPRWIFGCSESRDFSAESANY